MVGCRKGARTEMKGALLVPTAMPAVTDPTRANKDSIKIRG
jgi:hypothetical protein